MSNQTPGHLCSKCTPGFPPENDKSLPWQDESNVFHYDCPWPDLQEAAEMVGWNSKFRVGVHPVSLGWVRSLPRVFVEACDVVQSEIHDVQREAREREAARNG